MEFPPAVREILPQLAIRFLAILPQGLLKFLAVGLTGLAVHTTVFTIALHLGTGKSPAWFAGLCTSTLVAWSLNRKHTFIGTGRSRRDEMARYALVTLVAQGVSFAVFHAVGHLAPYAPSPACVVVGSAVAAIFSYTGQRFFTFAPQRLAAYGV
ncbi:MAG TPA: GtrA family protein [Caulobacteraceae bacterium]|jgi:putative flippase GtrA|nr:GtrA family protein [Caulobacteraceae bacterium]